MFIYVKRAPEMMIETLMAAFETAAITRIQKNLLKLTFTQGEETTSFDDVRTLIFTDFQINLTTAILPAGYETYISDEHLQKLLPKLNPGDYHFESILLILIKQKPAMLSELKTTLSKHLSNTDIITLQAYSAHHLNALKTAKHLYIHRNTLHYRLDQIKEKTFIDVKTFKGLVIMELLFGQWFVHFAHTIVLLFRVQ